MAKKIITWVVTVVVIVGLVGMIGVWTNGFNRDKDTWSIRERNDKNLFDNADYTITDKNTGRGVYITVNKDGSLVIDGKLTGSDDYEIAVGTVSLKAGTYTFTSGYKAAGLTTAYLKLVTSGGEYSADFGGDNGTFTIDADAEGTVYLVIAPDYSFSNKTIYPVIASGNEEVSFYK